MKYRKFGQLNWDVSAISLGLFTLEDLAAGSDGADRETRNDGILYAVEQGVNYINLGYPYYFDDPAEGCACVAKVLQGCREKVKLAVNVPGRDAASLNDLKLSLETQLKWFGLEKADFCIISGVDRAVWKKLNSMNIAAWAANIIDSGRVEYMGIAYHDDAHYLNDINNDFPCLTVTQLELSFQDYKHHPGIGGFKFTQQYGNAVIASDITKAGRLLQNIPENVQQIWDAAKVKRPIAETCTRWVLGLQEVSSALIPCKSAEQIKAYIAYAKSLENAEVDMWETLLTNNVRQAYYSNRFVQCTACRCCMPCSLGIDVPRIIELYNDYIMFSDKRIPALLYKLEKHSLTDCVDCGVCMNNCPKHIQITDILNKSHDLYTQ